LKNWIAHISESLQDMKMDISMAEINAKKVEDLSEEVESDLLENFKEKYGEYPLLNKKCGKLHQNSHTYSRSSLQPLHSKKTLKKGWAIRPMDGNPWARQLD